MTFNKFKEILKSKYPEATACSHGEFAGTERNKKVEINFFRNGKCYEYYGSYIEILNRIGIPCVYESDIKWGEKRLAELKERHGKSNPFSLFNKTPVDNSKEIEKMEKWLSDIKSGHYIIIN